MVAAVVAACVQRKQAVSENNNFGWSWFWAFCIWVTLVCIWLRLVKIHSVLEAIAGKE